MTLAESAICELAKECDRCVHVDPMQAVAVIRKTVADLRAAVLRDTAPYRLPLDSE